MSSALSNVSKNCSSIPDAWGKGIDVGPTGKQCVIVAIAAGAFAILSIALTAVVG